MKASQLRDLTRKYAAGNLGRDEYVTARARLIDGIVRGDIEIVYRDLDPASRTANTTAGQKHWLLAGGSIMLIGLLLVALLVYFLDDNTPRTPAAGGAAADVVKEPGVELLQHFLDAGDWSEASVQRLEDDWTKLTAFERESARRSAGYRRLKYETTRRIREQEALLAAGQMEALLLATRLQAFAERLGIPAGK